MLRVAINGLGRIGKAIIRAYAQNPCYSDKMEIVALNTGSGPAQMHAHLLKYDSVHGIFNGIREVTDNSIDFGFGEVPLTFHRTPDDLDFSGVDVVLECSGIYKDRESVKFHLGAGAKKVIVSAPCKDVDATIVMGVNENLLDTEKHDIISIGSCTTNCLAPVAKLLNDSIGIEKGFVTTVHSYTNDQQILDKSHKDLQRARAGGISMIPTSTGAAKAIGLVIPELESKLDGKAIRVPTPNVSFIDLSFKSIKHTSIEEINNMFAKAADNILSYNQEKLVSIDFNGNPHSAVFDANETKVIGDDFCRVGAWYDNEIGFSRRMLDATLLFGAVK